jgi:hypothetical protein
MSSATLPRHSLPLPWLAVVRGGLSLFVLAAAGLATMHFDVVLPWMIPACLIGLALGAWSARGRAALANALLFAGFSMTIGLVPTTALLGSGTIGPLSPAELPAHQSAVGYRLQDARIATEFTAAQTFRSARTGGSPVLWQAAPLVDSTWRKDQPVPAWVIAQETAGSDPASPAARQRWSDQVAAVSRVAAPSHGRGPEVIALAAQRHGLTNLPHAVVVVRSDDPEADRRSDITLILALLTGALMIHVAIVSRFWRRWT